MTPVLTAALELLQAHVADLEAVYLFGSIAHGDSTPGSDVDLAVLTPRGLNSQSRFDLQEDLAARLGCDVDLVDLRQASTVFALQVITTGRVLLDLDSRARGLFEDFTFGRYARLNEERRGILERIAREGSVYGR